jgi:hypothetical protein
MEILHSDLPFWSPMFFRTTIFSHPDVLFVDFRYQPVPHFYIEGTLQGVQSAMIRWYCYFISRHANDMFKQVSADSRTS